MNQKLFTAEQLSLVQELCDTHDLQPEQISFEGNDLNPIFDYEAACALSVKLTDIQHINAQVTERETVDGVLMSTALGTATLPDGRSRTIEDSAFVGETIGNGKTLATVRDADSMAQNRAVRRAIRSVGVNLYNAHKKFKETGQIATGQMIPANPRAAALAELHALAAECGLIVNGDRARYEKFIADSYDGATSSSQLNDLDFQRLMIQLRAMARHARSMQKVPA